LTEKLSVKTPLAANPNGEKESNGNIPDVNTKRNDQKSAIGTPNTTFSIGNSLPTEAVIAPIAPTEPDVVPATTVVPETRPIAELSGVPLPSSVIAQPQVPPVNVPGSVDATSIGQPTPPPIVEPVISSSSISDVVLPLPTNEPVVVLPPVNEPVVISPPSNPPVVSSPLPTNPVVVVPPVNDPVIISPPSNPPVVISPLPLPSNPPVVVLPPSNQPSSTNLPVVVLPPINQTPTNNQPAVISSPSDQSTPPGNDPTIPNNAPTGPGQTGPGNIPPSNETPPTPETPPTTNQGVPARNGDGQSAPVPNNGEIPIRPTVQNSEQNPRGISSFLQSNEQQIEARVIENQSNTDTQAPVPPSPDSPTTDSSTSNSTTSFVPLPLVLAITGGVLVVGIAGILLIRRTVNKTEPGLPRPVSFSGSFSEPSNSPMIKSLEQDNIFSMPRSTPYEPMSMARTTPSPYVPMALPQTSSFEPMFTEPQLNSFAPMHTFDRRASMISTQSLGNEQTGLLHRHSDLFTDDFMSESSSLNRFQPKQDVSHNLANIALLAATDDSSKHSSLSSDSNYSTSTYSQFNRESQYTTGTFEFSEMSDYDTFLQSQSLEGSQLADAAIQMIRRNREAQRDSLDSLF
jgi:hypothetical protein